MSTSMPLAEVLAKIAPLPWHEGNEAIWSDHNGDGNSPTEVCSFVAPMNAAYLAHAANHLPKLVEALEDLLASHPAARAYPDGPCIESQIRKELLSALAAAQSVEVP